MTRNFAYLLQRLIFIFIFIFNNLAVRKHSNNNASFLLGTLIIMLLSDVILISFY